MPRKAIDPLQSDTLRAIQEQAFTLFGRYGYNGVSIGDIANSTKLSKGALYWHFAGKESLYLDCMARLHALFDQYLFDPMRAANDGVAGIGALFRGLEQLLVDPRVRNGIAGYWLVPSGPEATAFAQARRAFETTAQRAIVQTLERGIALGQFALAGDLENFAAAIMSIGEAVVLPLRRKSPHEIRGVLDAVALTLLRAYGTPTAAITPVRWKSRGQRSDGEEMQRDSNPG
jgi:AcrR family transcriptional regulator